MSASENTAQTFDYILSQLQGAKTNGGGFMARCPAHDDHNPSLSLKLADNGKILLNCFAGCTTADICEALGVAVSDLSPREKAEDVFGDLGRNKRQEKPKKPCPPPTYLYHDQGGKVMFGVVRGQGPGGKYFYPCHQEGGKWWAGLAGIEPTPYRLPELIAAAGNNKTIYIPEGEKDVETLAALGLTATTNQGGAQSHERTDFERYLKGAAVVILGDNDEPGEKRAQEMAARLYDVAASVKVVIFKELPQGGDVTDWLNQGHTKKELLARVDAAPIWKPGQKNKKRLSYVCLANVEPESVDWLWYPYIPIGKITLLEGDPAAGKTWLALAIAAKVSAGGAFPDYETGRTIGRRPLGAVIYLTAEDGLGDTLRPRLDSLFANVGNIYSITGTQDEKGDGVFTFSDLDLLDEMASEIKPKLIVVDPLQAFLGEKVDMHRANETRPVLSRLAALAERHKCAVLVLRHLSKASATKNIYRGMGSIDFTAAARSVLLAGCDPQDPNIRAFVQIKSSLAPTGKGQGYSLSPQNGFAWTGVTDMTASTMLGSETMPENEKTDKVGEAAQWLEEVLSKGPVEKRIIEGMAENRNIKPITLRRAKTKLMLLSYKKPGEKNGPYVWELPGNNSQPRVDQDGKTIDFPQGQTMINPSTREKVSNGAGSTGCSSKNDDQPVEVNGGKAYSDFYGLINLYPWGGQPVNGAVDQPVGESLIGKNGKDIQLEWDDI